MIYASMDLRPYYVLQGRAAQKGHLVTRITVTSSILCDLKSYEDTSPSYVLFREEGAGDVTKRVNARDENEINNTGFGVNRYRCVH